MTRVADLPAQEIPEAFRLPVPLKPRRQQAPPTPPRRVFGWLGDNAGCAYYRVTLPMRNLNGNRWVAAAGTDITEVDVHFGWDTIIGQRVFKDGVSDRWLRLCADPNVKAVYELDDDFWAIDSTNPAYSVYSRADVRASLQRNIAAADLVTVSTEPLAERVRAWNPNVVILPNYVDARMLDIERGAEPVDTVTIGWEGSATHAMDWPVAQAQVADVVRTENVRMAFLGKRYATGFPRDRTVWVPWQDNQFMYYEHLATLVDIAVAPLIDHPFNASKSSIRVLEASALGIPVVASDVRPYREFVQHGVTGFLVRQPEDWGRYLRDLIHDRAMRIEMGENARKQAAEYTIQGHIGEYERAWSA